MGATWKNGPAILAAALAPLACGGDGPSGPGGAKGQLLFESGYHQEDSVFAGLGDPLVVRVVRGGSAVAGAAVHFRALGEAWTPHVYLEREGREFTEVVDTTDAAGRAAVQVGFGGPRAGYAWIEVEVPEIGALDSAFYVILPGRPVEPPHAIFPFYPATVVGRVEEVWAVSRDAHGNNVSLVPTACATTSAKLLEVRPGCALLGLVPGNAEVVLEHGAFTRTFTVPVLPPAILAIPGQEGVIVAELGGEVRHRLPPLSYLDWSPGGDRLVGQRRPDIYSPAHLHILTLAGEERELIPQFAGSLGEEAPQYSADGQWIYFHAWRPAGASEIWRIAANGVGPERVGPAATPGERYRYPSPSPDGGSVVFSFEGPGTHTELRILDTASGEVRQLGLRGNRPRWSPDGAWIAFFTNAGALGVVRPDGSDVRTLMHGGDHLNWSPDGHYIVVQDGLLSVATGERLPFRSLLPASAGWFAGVPAWQP